MRDHFDPGWFLIGRGPKLHYVKSFNGRCFGRVSACGIHAEKDRVYSGHSTSICKACLKIAGRNGITK